MDNNLIATASVPINATGARVWDALVDPAAIKEYMFGTTVVTDWREGSPIVWKGEWRGKPYEDKGVILQCLAGRSLHYTHFSPLTGLPENRDNYQTVTIELSGEGEHTRVSLTQDKNPTDQAREASAKNWRMMLAGLKKFVER